ncbi:glycoside hydrolase family 13 protein [Streptomyces sp. Ag109_O5-10]|uniref:glycoside hydrolase family 13 protein n=1 Tax=Streptomyces sp. Ag109_O5-10 TaxID=1855349 RepID=UPI0008982737|nr:glycoside hydrolase family 13 protein [Streptomyces sp. Ag109_O5-10]SED61551.1 alpha-glucosidase [Streptomyces sp. Ag109_O5-10]
MTVTPAPVPPSCWWREAVCYEIHPRAFADGNADGVGDLPGATARLEHLAGLGVDAVWITPFYPSPLADGGYDIADHTGVAADLGTAADFAALVTKAHTLGLKVLVDVVPNHTSHRHPWFRAALAAGPRSAARERYLFRDGRGEKGELPPNDWQSAFGGPAWTRIDEADGLPGQWYLHLHAPEQPDLNWRNTEVPAEFERILRHWLDQGVDGFRVDVAHTLFKAEGLPDAGPGQHQDVHRNHLMPYYDQEELHPQFRRWRALLDNHPAPAGAVPPHERVMVAEAGVFDRERLARYVAPGEMQQIFNFAFLESAWDGPAMRDVIDRSVQAMSAVGAPVTWVLSSHDAVRPVTRYGGGPLGERRARAAALLMLALPGAAYVYQGEELGLPQAHVPDDRIRDPLWERSGHRVRGRDGSRVPLPWAGGVPPYGFSDADPDSCWLPQPPGWAALTVAAQRDDASSMFTLYRAALHLRRAHPPMRTGLHLQGPASGEWFAFDRSAGLRCLVNFGARPVRLDDRARVLLSSAPLDGRDVPQDTTVWIVLEEYPQ